jgi:hypothetical protein
MKCQLLWVDLGREAANAGDDAVQIREASASHTQLPMGQKTGRPIKAGATRVIGLSGLVPGTPDRAVD